MDTEDAIRLDDQFRDVFERLEDERRARERLEERVAELERLLREAASVLDRAGA